MKLRVFIIKVATSGSLLTFLKRNAITGRDLPNGPVPGALRSDGKTLFLVYTYVWQEDVAKIYEVPGAPRNVNPARAITWLLSVTIYCMVFSNYSPPSTSLVFTLKNAFEKKII